MDVLHKSVNELNKVFVLIPDSSVTLSSSSFGFAVLAFERSWHSKPTVYTRSAACPESGDKLTTRCVYSSKAEMLPSLPNVLFNMSLMSTWGAPVRVRMILSNLFRCMCYLTDGARCTPKRKTTPEPDNLN